MKNLPADQRVKHGRHIDEFWPGTVHSTWEFGKRFKIRRERTYSDPNNNALVKEAWIVMWNIGSHRGGWKCERDI